MSNEIQNSAAIIEFEQEAPIVKSIGAEIMASREAQEVQVAMVAAKKFPRDIYNAYNRIIQDCKRKTLAEKALYEYPRGGQTISGPSIHLAKSLARNWGNLDSGFKVLEQTGKESTVMAYCWDLETNYRETKVFTVKHMRETKKGAYPVKEPRDIYELVANQASRRERSCILSVIPGDIVDAAVGECMATLEGDTKMTKDEATRDIINRFQEKYGIPKIALEKYIGRKAEAFTIQSIVKLRNIFNTLRDSSASVEQYFDMSLVAPSVELETDSTPVENPENQVSLKDI